MLTELHNPIVKDILIASVEGLKSFPDAINIVFPNTQIQLCIVSMARNSMDFVLRKDYKVFATDLNQIYQSSTEESALLFLGGFSVRWDEKNRRSVNLGTVLEKPEYCIQLPSQY